MYMHICILFCISGQTEWAEVRLQRMIEEHQVVVHELEAEKKERQRLSEVQKCARSMISPQLYISDDD